MRHRLTGRRLPGTLPRARRDGSTAVEFALIAMPFFFLIFAILELALIFATNALLENATLNVSRLVRTGLVADQGVSAAAFKTALCRDMGPLSMDCENRTDIDVRVINQFRSAPPPSPIVNGVLDENQLQFLPGNPGSLVLIRVWYSQPLMTPFLSQAVSRLRSGDVVLGAATAFRNEPA